MTSYEQSEELGLCCVQDLAQAGIGALAPRADALGQNAGVVNPRPASDRWRRDVLLPCATWWETARQ